jgi:hypothetical protein
MQIKLSTVVALKEIGTQIGDLKLPLKLTYKLVKFFNSINSEADFYTSRVQKLLGEYAEKDAQGNFIHPNEDDPSSVQLKPNTKEVMLQALNELLDLEVTIPDFLLTMEEAEQLNLSVNEFSLMMPFIQEEKEDSK